MFLKSGVIILVIYGVIQLSVVNSVSADEDECPKICPANYDPLCATNGKIYKEFSNTCELKASNCRLESSALQKYVATAMDWCVTELVDDLNHLVLKLDNLDLQTPDCLKPCPMIYSPVCASNGIYRAIISNKCIMDSFNCALDKKGTSIPAFRILQYGSC